MNKQNPKNILLSGKRVNFKRIEKSDLKILQKWRNSDEIWQFNTQFTLLNMINQKEWYEQNTQKISDRIMFMITNKIGKSIGICGLINLNSKDHSASIAIIIGEKKHHNRGFGQEILKLLLNYGFSKLKLHRIESDVFEYNENSLHLFKKMNFKQEVVLRDSLWRKGKWWDIHKFSLIRNEFKNDF
jgi:RimJ/RimL family protein N-acetyltransferase|tara:strand:+ start:140 stop:697 length:558 start_codon:yes stop_codon:yes gene_type:complete